jgi:hypothetical protein
VYREAKRLGVRSCHRSLHGSAGLVFLEVQA